MEENEAKYPHDTKLEELIEECSVNGNKPQRAFAELLKDETRRDRILSGVSNLLKSEKTFRPKIHPNYLLDFAHVEPIPNISDTLGKMSFPKKIISIDETSFHCLKDLSAKETAELHARIYDTIHMFLDDRED